MNSIGGCWMRNFYKNGMTLGELCIVFAIMGVIASMTIISAKPYEKSLKYSYEKVYNSLETAFYNAQLNFKTEMRYVKVNKPNSETPWAQAEGTFPLNAQTFCYLVFGYINTAQGSSLCSSKTFKAVDATADNIDTALENAKSKSALIASNGVTYWIAKPTNSSEGQDYGTIRYKQGNGDNCTEGESGCFTKKFYIIYVDLNGNMPPNTTQWTEKKPADIVPFIITEDADVIPMGAPVADARYLTALVEYNSFTTDENGEQKQEYSQPMTYYEAMRKSWATEESSSTNIYDGIFTNADNSMTINFSTILPPKDYPTLYPPISLINEYMRKLTFDKNNCGKRDDHETLNPNACTIKIKNYF